MVACLFSFSTLASAGVAPGIGDMTVLEKIVVLENAFYGNPQTGSVLDRIVQLENDFYGMNSTGESIIEKVDNLYANVYNVRTGETSVLVQMNGVEWAISHSVSDEPLKMRLENLEKMLEGNSKTGSFQSRINDLISLSFSNGTLTLMETVIPANTLIKIRLQQDLDGKTTQKGDIVDYVVADDVILNGALVFANGSKGRGTVADVRQARNFGRDGKLEVDFANVYAVDGNNIGTFLGEEAKKETEMMAVAAGATVATMALLGPVGIVTGAFVKGKNIKIPAGSELYIQTSAEVTVDGIQVGE